MNIVILEHEINFLRKQRLAKLLFAPLIRATCVWLLLFSLPANADTSLPLSVPIHFDTDKVVELSAELTRYRNYNLDIVFRFRDDQERAFAKKVVGEPTRSCKISNECGDTVSFVVTIKVGLEVITKQEKKVFGVYAFSATQFYRNILIMPLRPGRYTITVEPTEFTENMMRTNAAIELSTDARASDLEK
jgi:Domain of unknown function (DUF5625)